MPLFGDALPFLNSRNDALPFGVKKNHFFKYQSHMAFSSVLPFLLPTHSVDCAVHLIIVPFKGTFG